MRSARALPQPPLTEAGMAAYPGVMAAAEITVTGTLPSGNTTDQTLSAGLRWRF